MYKDDSGTDDGQNNNSSSAAEEFPTANVEPRTSRFSRLFGSTRMWMATAVCALIAIILVVLTWTNFGTHIVISFDDGYGIKPGDTLRFRGIDIGEVFKVDINSTLDGVTVHVDLQLNASELARDGSQFWIERPQLGLARISGLETVIGAKFIGVIPGENTARPRYRFKGIESPPVIRNRSGSRITIKFDDGHGIATGDVVRHLGIVVGEVTAVEMADNLDSVTVHTRLTESAARVARAGSQFWIERPELGLLEIRGLETLIRGPFIDFLPGPEEGPVVRHFQGVSHAPPAARQADGLEVLLTSNQKRALKVGVPVTYRGLKVGHVVSVSLAPDASSIRARVYIEPEYKSLVRIDSQFWSNVGIDADVGVTGIQLKTDSLQSLAIGSIGFATPENPGRKARTGDRFTCARALQDKWLDWNPQIAVGEQMLPEGANRPEPIRSTIRWNKKRLGMTRPEHRLGWLLLLDNQKLLGLSRYLQPAGNAIEGSVKFELSGVEFAYEKNRLTSSGELSMYRTDSQMPERTTWPIEKIRRPTGPEECLIVSDPQTTASPLSVIQIDQSLEDRWLIVPAMSYHAALDGACVVSRSDGCLVGFLDLEKGQAVVVFVDK